MFKTILLPVDLSERHGPALEMAGRLIDRKEGKVHLLHVVETMAGLPVEEEKVFYQRLERAAQKQLKTLADLLKRDQVPFHGEVLFGHRGPEIVNYARKNQVDLIVLTSPPITADNLRSGWGSLSYKVSFFAPCPVLLVR